MKIKINLFLLIIFSVFFVVACNKDDSPIEDNNVNEYSSTPCDFVLNDIQTNDTIRIDCLLDLNEETINLPSNVTLIYDGGDIINGILNFTGDNNIISGEFLNSSLILQGVLPQLEEETFNFISERWGIIEGKVSDEVALKNKEIINEVMSLAKEMKVVKFQLDEIDAYFDVSARVNNPLIKSESAILIPSNFELSMSDNSFLRVQPTNAHTYSLVMVYKGENIKISGGNLIGDRWEHNYAPVVDLNGNEFSSHEWGHVTHVSGGKNIILENINISNASGDGFNVHGSQIRAVDGSPGNAVISENVTVRNCTIDASRRNGLSILDGDGILIEKCKIINTGLGENPSGIDYSSAGTWPKQGINTEAWRVREADGTLLEYERVENIVIRENTFEENFGADIVLFTCSFVTIEDNNFDATISNKASHDIIIRNNTMQSRIENGEARVNAMVFKTELDPFGNEFNFNYQVYGNRINGYQNGITLAGDNFEVYNNTLTNFKSGIVLSDKLYGASIYDNTLTTDVPTSFGYVSRAGDRDMKDVTIKNEEVTVTRRSLDLYDLVAQDNLIFDNCTFISTENKANNIDGCENITIQNSTINTDITIVNSTNIQLINNSE